MNKQENKCVSWFCKRIKKNGQISGMSNKEKTECTNKQESNKWDEHIKTNPSDIKNIIR